MIDRDLEEYICRNSQGEDPLLAELDRQTHLRAINPQMLSGHIQGLLLRMLVRIFNPSAALEIGTYTGYSTLCIAAGLSPDGVVDTIESDDELSAISGEFFRSSPYGSLIRQHIGSAAEVLPRLERTYDFVFIDADKREYPLYYQLLMGDLGNPAMVRSGSVILADNVLWYGKVTDLSTYHDPHTLGVDAFNRMVKDDPRVENVLIPIRDGINIIRVI